MSETESFMWITCVRTLKNLVAVVMHDLMPGLFTLIQQDNEASGQDFVAVFTNSQALLGLLIS